jgi:hypothetical protein
MEKWGQAWKQKIGKNSVQIKPRKKLKQILKNLNCEVDRTKCIEQANSLFKMIQSQLNFIYLPFSLNKSV